MDALEAAQGLEIHGIATHRQVLALDQRVAQIARQIGMLEIGFVVRPRRQQHHMRLFVAFERRERREAILLATEKVGDMLDMQVAEHLGEDARNDQPVLQRVARPRGRLRAVGDDPPAAVRRTCEVDRIMMQPDAARRLDPLARPQVTVLAVHQRRRQQAFREQSLFAVEVGQHGVEQRRALGHGSRNLGPFVMRDDQRQRIKRPRTVRTLGVGIDIVSDPVFLNPPVDEFEPLLHVFRRHRIEMAEKFPPVRTHRPFFRQHFVVTVGAVRIDRE